MTQKRQIVQLEVGVVRRLLAAGYTRIQLHTEYYRLSALNIYFKLGFVPLLNTAVVIPVWQDVCARLGQPYTPVQRAGAIRQADDSGTGQGQSHWPSLPHPDGRPEIG
jgi:hypothetical protein